MRKKTHEEFIEQVYELVGDEYRVLEKYINARTKILMKHEVCNYTWKVKPQHFITSGSRCPNCSKHRIRTMDEFLDELKIIGNNEFELISNYTYANTKVRLKHDCGYEWDVVPEYFYAKGLRCPKCDGCIRNRDLEYFKKEVYELVRNEYEVLGEYMDTRTHILMKHNNCSFEYYVAPYSFFSGKRCPNCNMSQGEEKIKSYLHKNNITFSKEYKFKDCINTSQLRFDFAVFNDDKLKLLIEYDGSQHYSSKFGEDKLFYTKQNDYIKNKYCIDNNISLIRIPYWDFDNIEEILEKKFNDLIEEVV